MKGQLENSDFKITIMKRILFIINIQLLLFSNSFAQENAAKKIVTVQPKIMVVPFVKENEDFRYVFEADINKRVALNKIKEHFDNRGFTTVDFLVKYKGMKESMNLNGSNQSDIKSTIIKNSGADIYVDAEIDYQRSSTGNSINLLLTAYESATANSLSNKSGFSGKFYTDDVARLTSRAVESCIEEFLNTMQNKFRQIIEDGRSTVVEVGVSQDSKYNLSSEFKGLPLSDLLEEWVGKNAYKNNYHIQGTADNLMIFDDIRIPLKDPETGLNYNQNKFATLLYLFFSENNISITRTIKNGIIYITIK